MNINEENFDPDREVFVISDDTSSENSQHIVEKTNYNFKEEESMGLVKLASISFLCIIFVAGFVKSFDSTSSKINAFGFCAVTLISLFFYFFIKAGKGAEKRMNDKTFNMLVHSRQLKNKSQGASLRKKKQKKFNNVEEYKNSIEFKIDEAAKLKQASDDIELAVEALCRLGLGKRKASEWVTRGIDCGILSSDTQKLIKFALSRGATI
jgi:hypothetical protein